MPAQLEVSNELIAKAQACSESAENALFGKLHARVLPVIQRRLCQGLHLLAETPEGIAQEVCLTMLNINPNTGKRKYKTIERERFLGWVFTIVYHKIGDCLRKIKKRQAVMTALDNNSMDFPDSSEDLDHVDWDIELDRIILKVLPQMDHKCRNTMKALINELRTGEAIPDELAGVKKSIWYPRVSRCWQKLRKKLRKEGWQL